MREKTIIYYRENLLQSVIADIYTFGIIILAYWINYNFIGNSKFVSWLLLVMFMIFVIGKGLGSGKTFTSKEELTKYLNN
jgi:hypothetical protein